MSGPTTNRFYVYEHWRPDLDICFWVGKGTGDRSRRFKRNDAYNRIVAELATLGMCAEVRMVRSGLTETEAFAIEREQIVFWRGLSVILANRTNGGDGNRGMFVSDVTRDKLRRANLGKKHSPETISKMKIAHLGKGKGRAPGFKHSEATIEKIRSSNVGKKLSSEQREKLRIANLGKKHSPETKEKMSDSGIGNTNGAGGKGLRRSDATIGRMREAQKGHQVSIETRLKISESLKKRFLERVT